LNGLHELATQDVLVDNKIRVKAPPSRVFKALSTGEGLKGWHTPQVEGEPGEGKEVTFRFTDEPDITGAARAASLKAERLSRANAQAPQRILSLHRSVRCPKHLFEARTSAKKRLQAQD
jgi:hypothetical protein